MTEIFKSFGLVKDKLRETEFFLNSILSPKENMLTLRYHFSAFVSAARSVTFTMQSVMSDVEGFSDWYEEKVKEMKQSELMRFFIKRRNEAEKEGNTAINDFELYFDEHGKFAAKFFFTDKQGRLIVDDVKSACKKHFPALQDLVLECIQRFPKHTDPSWWYNIDNLRSEGWSIEDLEESLGFPRGWTAMVPDEERLELLWSSTPPADAKAIFEHIKRIDEQKISFD